MTKVFHYIFGCLSILIFLNVNSSSQNIKEDINLQPGQTVEREMTGKETHRYKFTLKKDEFFQVRVRQKSVDVMLKLFDSGATILATMDSPNGREGSETLSFISDKNGEFVLEISGFDEKAEKGIYTINRIASRTATSSDKKRVETEQIFVEGMKAHDTDGQGETAITKLEQALNGWRELKDEYLIQLTIGQINQLKKTQADATFDEALGLFQQGTAETYQSALEKFQQASSIYEEIDDKSENSGIAILVSGRISDSLGKKQEALRSYNKILKFFQVNNYKNWEAVTLNNIGSVYHSLGETQKALDYFNQSLPLSKEVGNKSQEAITLSNIGSVYDDLGEKQKALDYFNQSLPLSKEVGDKSGEATTLNNIANVYDDLGKKQKALGYFNQSLSLRKSVGDITGEAIILSNIGRVYDDLGEKQKALDYFNQALPLSKEVGDKFQEAITLSNIGSVYDSLGKKQKALDYFNQSLPLSKEFGDKSQEATTLTGIGGVYDSLGEKQKALDYFNQSLPLSKEVSDKPQEAATLNNIGGVYDSLGEKQKALDYFNQSLSLRKSVGDMMGEAITLSNIGSVYASLGENRKALEYFNQSLPLSKEVGDKSGEAGTLSNIGNVYASLGDNRKALDYFNQALSLRKSVGNKAGEATILSNIGRTYSSLGEKQKALEYFNQSLPLSKEIGDKSQEAVTLNNIGSIYIDLGDNRKALEYFNQSLLLRKSVGNKAGEAVTLSNIGGIYNELGENRKALEYLNQSLLLRKSVGDKAGEAITLNNMMVVWYGSGNQKLAVFYGKQSVNLYQQLRANIKGLDQGIQQTYANSISSTYRDVSDILIADGRLLEAQAILDLLKEEEFAGLTRRGGEDTENVPYSAAEKAALKILEKLATLGREKGELDDKNLKGSLTEIERQRFRDLQKQIELTEAEFDKSLAALSAETDTADNYEIVFKDAQAFMSTLKELGDGTVALYTVIVNDVKPTLEGVQSKDSTAEKIKIGWIILVTPEFRKAYPVDVRDLEQTIAKFRRTLTSPYYDPLPFAQQLYKKMFLQISDKQKTTLAADLDEYFRNKPNKTLMWSLDGIFRYVPIAALHDGDQYLVGKYRNTIFNTASKDRLKDAVKANWTALGLGVSLGRTESGKAFSSLPGAKKELLKIVRQNNSSGIIKGTVKLDDQFTDEAMFDALSFDKNPLVHIASHFSYQIADFNESFLLLGKGKMTVKDMSVKSNLFSNVDLLTLSACETAVPNANGRDVEGFAFIAQRLGAKSVMATLWQVDDIGTQVLMPEFYRLRETGLGKGEALRKVQLEMLNGRIKDIPADVKRSDVIILDADRSDLRPYKKDDSKPFAHPFYWSPFVLIGNWK